MRLATSPIGHDFAVYYRNDGETIPSPGIIPIAIISGGTEIFNLPGASGDTQNRPMRDG